jgi:hypothetical protein
MNWADCGILAIFISGAVLLTTRSKLSGLVLFYLAGILFIQSFFSEIHPEGKLKIFPALPIVVLFQWFCLGILEKTHIKSNITPAMILIAALFGAVCTVESLFGQHFFRGYLGMVHGLTSLLAALEGLWYGGSGLIKRTNTGDRRSNLSGSLHFQDIQAHKKD